MADGEAKGDPAFTVRRSPAGYRIEAPWLDAPIVERAPLRAAGHLAVDLIEAWLAEHPDRLALHCAAALFGGRLLLFPGAARAGKSLLSARLAAAGIPVFTDDVLVLGEDDRSGVSLGMMVRVRLPLPANAGTLLAGMVAGDRGMGDSAYRYLHLPAAVRPRLGRTAPIGAIVWLDRRVGLAEARINPLDPGDGLEQLLTRAMSSNPDMLARLAGLVAATPCFSLAYADPDDAFDALARRFEDWSRVPVSTHPPPVASGARLAVAEDEPRFVVAREARLHRIGEGGFIEGADGASHRLDALALGIWDLLARPTGVEEAAAIVAGAFPDTDPGRIRRDVADLFDALAACGLVRPA